MDKQARLSAILHSIKEYKEKEESRLYGAELAVKTREYARLGVLAKKLEAIVVEVAILNDEAKALQDEIELESREELL